MNAEPHVHAVSVTTAYGEHNYKLTYGDTDVKIRLCGEEYPTEKQIRRAFRKAVKRHDEGSINAGEYEAMKKNVTQELYEEQRKALGLPEPEAIVARSNVTFQLPSVWGNTLYDDAHSYTFYGDNISDHRHGIYKEEV